MILYTVWELSVGPSEYVLQPKRPLGLFLFNISPSHTSWVAVTKLPFSLSGKEKRQGKTITLPEKIYHFARTSGCWGLKTERKRGRKRLGESLGKEGQSV